MTSCSRLAFAVAFLVVGPGPFAAADVLKVPQQFDTISAAISSAATGDRIIVSAGTYSEQVVIDSINGLSLEAKGKVTIVSPTPLVSSGLILISNADLTQVQGFRLKPSPGFFGIQVIDSSDCAVRDCEVIGGDVGITAALFDGLVIDRCAVKGSQAGIVLNGSAATVRRCTIKQVDFDGILANVVAVEITNNKVSDAVGNGIGVGSTARLAMVNDNLVREVGEVGIAFDDPLTGGTIAGNHVIDARDGYSGFGDHITVLDNEIKECFEYGIAVRESNTATFGNRVTKCGTGIFIGDLSSNGLHVGNVVTRSTVVGILLGPGAVQNAITKNIVKKSATFDLQDDSGGTNDFFENRFGSIAP